MIQCLGPKFVKKVGMWCVTIKIDKKQTEEWYSEKQQAEKAMKEYNKKQ